MNGRTDLYGELQQLQLQLGEVETRDVDVVLSPEEQDKLSEAARIAFEGHPEKTFFGENKAKRWFEDYLRLKELGYPWRVAVWISWAASPKKDRWPKTQEELATQVLGLSSDRAVGNWRKKYSTIDAVVATLQAAPLIDHRRDIFEALAESAADPDHRHNPDRKLALEMTGDFVPHMTVEDKRKAGNAGDLSALSDADLEEAKKRLLGKSGASSYAESLNLSDEVINNPTPSLSPEGRGTSIEDSE